MVQGPQLQPQAVQVQPQLVQGILAAIMVVWMATYVLSQVIKGFKGEEVEKPPLG
jgi:hypothetical protein